MIFSFNSRPHTEVDKMRRKRTYHLQTFNSRPHTEVDVHRLELQLSRIKPFNSRPHTEVDLLAGIIFSIKIVLSIHDLTRRSTSPVLIRRKRTIFQFTTSHGGRHGWRKAKKKWRTFNSRPHTEVDSSASSSASTISPNFQFTTSHGGRLL